MTIAAPHDRNSHRRCWTTRNSIERKKFGEIRVGNYLGARVAGAESRVDRLRRLFALLGMRGMGC
jgi:hypothetical protein